MDNLKVKLKQEKDINLNLQKENECLKTQITECQIKIGKLLIQKDTKDYVDKECNTIDSFNFLKNNQNITAFIQMFKNNTEKNFTKSKKLEAIERLERIKKINRIEELEKNIKEYKNTSEKLKQEIVVLKKIINSMEESNHEKYIKLSDEIGRLSINLRYAHILLQEEREKNNAIIKSIDIASQIFCIDNGIIQYLYYSNSHIGRCNRLKFIQ